MNDDLNRPPESARSKQFSRKPSVTNKSGKERRSISARKKDNIE